MTTAEGQLVGQGWKIGKQLGSGACGSVHELVSTSSTSNKSSSTTMAWAIKIAPLPPPSKSSTTSKSKRKKTACERNADLILHEYTTLQNAGSVMRGVLVPEIPFMGNPPGYGETPDKSFRFLVMERMAAPLSEVVSILLRESHFKPTTATKGGAKISLGNVAVAMFDCLRAMHDNGNLFIDVKPENFMLASASSTSNKKKDVSVGSRIRLIDFGLVERYGDMSTSKHRENMHPDAMLVGTPTYASLNIMEGHTPSRRDDLEALGYVICELILMFASSSSSSSSSVAAAATTSSKRKSKKEEEDEGVHVLPWSKATSDSELKVIKSREMDASQRLKSKLFQGLKSVGSEGVMNTYFTEVRGLGYSESPDYDAIRGNLIKLVVTITEGEKHKEKPPTKSHTGRRQSGRRKHDEDEEDDCDSDDSVKVIDENAINRGTKMQKVSKSTMTSGGDGTNSVAARRTNTSKGPAPLTREISTQTDVIDDDNTTSMDWEPVDDTAASDDDEKRKGVLKLCITEGPHVGHEIPFGGDLLGTVCVGKDPASRAMKDVIKFAIKKDTHASSVHAKFVINSKSKVLSVKVFDMASTGCITSVNGTALPSGKSRQAFVGDKIMCGESVFEIRKA